MPPESAVNTLFESAVALHKAGDAKAAADHYRKVLAQNPDHVEALYLSGALAFQQNDPRTALSSLDRALQLHPGHGPAREALRTVAAAFFNARGYGEASTGFRRLAIVAPGDTESLYYLAVSLRLQGELNEAANVYEKLIALQPDHARALDEYGGVLFDLRRIPEADAIIRRAIAAAPDLANPYTNLGRLYQSDPLRASEALKLHDQALARNPSYADAHNNRGAALHTLSRFEEAVTSFHQALVLKPAMSEAFNNLGTSLLKLGDVAGAIANYRQAVAMVPGYPEAHWNLALALLSVADYGDAWPAFEWRWQCRDFHSPRRPFVQRVWDGGHLGQGSLLVWGEQGVGDEILYGSMVGELVARGMPVLWEADARLLPLIQRSYPGLATVARTTPPDPATAAAGAHISTASLGQYLRPSTESFPKGRKSFLVADSAKAQAYRAKLLGGSKTRLIGLSWVSKNQELGIHKTTALTALAPLWQAVGPETRFVDLQYGDTATERAASGLDLAHLAELDLFNDLDGLAALISACDLVITVSNTTAHLAGALGVPVWVMVPAGNGKLWYWGETGSSWYPSAHVFRQNTPGAWDTLIADIAKKLAKP